MHPDLVLEKLTQRIREEFEETPGLQVTVGEGARFWGLDEMTCYQVLVRLRAAGMITVDADHRYRQALVDPDAGDRLSSVSSREGGTDEPIRFDRCTADRRTAEPAQVAPPFRG
jgi:hypothetical protein